MTGKYKITIKQPDGSVKSVANDLNEKDTVLAVLDDLLKNPAYIGCTVSVTCEYKVFDIQPSAAAQAAMKNAKEKIQGHKGRDQYKLRLVTGGDNESV